MNKWITAFLLLCLMQTITAQRSLPNRLDSLLKTIYADSLPGASVAVVTGKRLMFEESYGLKNSINQQKISSSTNFNIASLTKQFTAMAILQLAEQHKLSLSDKIGRFFPDMNRTIADCISVQNLLTHSSGIRDHYDYISTNGLLHAHNKDVYNAIKHVDSLYFAPGTKFRYSNTAYCLLALIVEKAGGVSYSDYMQQHIFKPAGMMHTTIWRESMAVSDSATGYDRDSLTKKFMPSGANEHIFFSTEGDGGIYTSVHDYLLWLDALDKEKIFTKEMVDRARSIQFAINAKQKLGYGFGWFVDESEMNKKIYHSGSNGGFRTYSFTIPNQHIRIVVFSNRSDIDIEETALRLYNVLFPHLKKFTKIEVLTS